MVVGDAFGGLSVPRHLTTREFKDEVDRVMSGDDGRYLILIDYVPLILRGPRWRRCAASSSTSRSSRRRPHFLGNRGANFVLVGAQRAVPRSEIQERFAARSRRSWWMT